MHIKSYAFFDLETTGLPSIERTPTKITEISFIACSVEHIRAIEKNKIPRVIHKLSLCLNPKKLISHKSTEITGKIFDKYALFEKNYILYFFI